MEELFTGIPDVIKDLTRMTIDVALKQRNPGEAAHILNNFINNMPPDPKLRDFADFYFNMRLEQLKNDQSNND